MRPLSTLKGRMQVKSKTNMSDASSGSMDSSPDASRYAEHGCPMVSSVGSYCQYSLESYVLGSVGVDSANRVVADLEAASHGGWGVPAHLLMQLG